MSTENVVETTTVTVPSKVAILKSKITREGLILGGVVAGIIIAGGLAILNASPSDEFEDESDDLDEPPFDTDALPES